MMLRYYNFDILINQFSIYMLNYLIVSWIHLGFNKI